MSAGYGEEPTDRPGRRADETGRQATGGARSEGVFQARQGSGGPRVSSERASTLDGTGATMIAAPGFSTGWKIGDGKPMGGVRRSTWPAWTVSSQPQSRAHAAVAAVLEAERAEERQFPSWAPAGESQQQYHGVTPQVRPSHCQLPVACGATADSRNATRATAQRKRSRVTPLL
jgi:hypothetical protein